MLGNGDLKDGIKGKIVCRENYDRMGQTISLAIGEAESGGISEAGSSEDVERGAVSARAEGSRRGGSFGGGISGAGRKLEKRSSSQREKNVKQRLDRRNSLRYTLDGTAGHSQCVGQL